MKFLATSAISLSTLTLFSTLTPLSASASQTRIIYADHYTEINTTYLIQQASDCVAEYITPVQSRAVVTKACALEKPLSLQSIYQTYPHLTQNPRAVDYWEGSYAKEVGVTYTYRRELVDTCRGRILETSLFNDTVTDTISFDVENPNLDQSVRESFMLVPMSERQANIAMAHQLHLCQTSK